MTLDPERDLQRIHSLVMANLEHLQTRIHLEAYNSNRQSLEMSGYGTMMQLQEICYQIEQKHRSYQRIIARDTKYGSK